TVNDATSITYQDRGHLFYVPTFPTGGQTFHYDVPLGPAGWGERGFWDTTVGQFKPWRIGTSWFGFGQLLGGDSQTGTIYTMSPSVYTEVNGVGMRRLRQPPPINFQQKRVRYDRVQLVMDVGVGAVTGQGVDPQVMLRSSNDGGRTFGPERSVSA